MDQQPLAGVKILVVDDHTDSRELVEFVLLREGAEVRLAISADEARAILQQWTPTVIVSDLTMPDEDGFSLIRTVRANPATERIPALALTAHAEEVARVRALAAGFQYHVTKPVNIDELLALIASLTASRESPPPPPR